MSSQRLQGHICILAANIIFGLFIPASKYLMANCLSGGTLTLARMWGAAALFWLASVFVKNDKVERRDLALFFLFSFCGVIMNQGIFIYGLGKTSPVDASVIATMIPLMVLVIAAVFMRDPITPRKALGVLSGAAGAIWLVLSAGNIARSTSSVSGDLLVLLSGVSTSIYFTMSKPVTSRHHPITMMKWMFLFASIILLPITPTVVGAENAVAGKWGFFEISALLFVIVGATFITYILLAMAIKRMRPTTMAMYNYVQPIIASAAAVYVGQDCFSWVKVAAAALVFFGVYLVTSSPRVRQ